MTESVALYFTRGQEKVGQNVFVISSTKLSRFLIRLVFLDHHFFDAYEISS